jgi:hypothetical protein
MHPESIAAANPPNPMPDPVETRARLGRLTVSFARRTVAIEATAHQSGQLRQSIAPTGVLILSQDR